MRPILPDGSGEIVPMRPRRVATGTGGVELVHDLATDLVDVPIVGRVAAGTPILAVENVTDTVRIDRLLIGGGNSGVPVFGLKIVGESMIEDGILDGDYVFVKKTPAARSWSR
jgi:repressor LexA